jgi:hypothetical protein
MNESSFFKNTVSAEDQLKNTQFIRYFLKKDAKLKVLFVGNSITYHEKAEHLGWMHACGMAATCLEKDYVHLVVKGLEEKYGDVSYCVTTAVGWEYDFAHAEEVLKQYEDLKYFDADIVILRIGENSNREQLADNDYETAFDGMAKFFFGNARKKVLTSLFWRYDPFDIPIEAVAKKNGYTFVSLNEFGARDDCKAYGEYEHGGVAQHPNDKGMEEIANAILKVL